MKKILIFMIIFLVLSTSFVFSEEKEKDADTESVNIEEEKSTVMLISPNIFGPLLGTIQIGFEFPISKSLSVEVSPSYFNVKISPVFNSFIEEADSDLNFDLWAIQGELSMNYFFSKKALEKGFLGIYVKGSYFKASIDENNMNLSCLGGGLKVGNRWVWGWLSIAPVVKLGYNYAFDPVADFFDSNDEFFVSYIKNMFSGIEYGCAIQLSIAKRK